MIKVEDSICDTKSGHKWETYGVKMRIIQNSTDRIKKGVKNVFNKVQE